MKKTLTLFMVMCCLIGLQAQTTFTNATSPLGLTGFNSGVAMAIADVNHDGLDDIVHLDQGTELRVSLQLVGGGFSTPSSFTSVGTSPQWSICVADIDDDGSSEIATGGYYDEVKLAKEGGFTGYTLSNLPGATIFIQGSNFADINDDGYLDFFACHDDAESRIWGNDRNGGFVEADTWIDMTNDPVDDEMNSGNYGSVWTDFDMDGDLDLYIAKCRQGVNDPSDVRRINVLFENNGDGTYTENAAAYNLNSGAQSWTVDFADYDNDGDFDCFLTQHDIPSQLFRNDGGTFVDVTTSSEINVGGFPIQGKFEDFDNDGYLDLLIAGTDEQLFLNDGDGTFTEALGLFDANNMESFALGDLNHDGFVDIYGGYAQIFNSPTTTDDAVWMNNGNSNNFITIQLEGVSSNSDGVGALVELHGAWGKQIREVRAGESYGIVNSLSCHFGIGTATAIDSVVVNWPAGGTDVVVAPAINQFLNILETPAPCESWQTVYSWNSLVSPDLPTACGVANAVTSTFEVWPNEAWTMDGLNTTTDYNFNFCSGYDPAVFPASISVWTYTTGASGIELLDLIAFAEGCSVDFTTTTATNYFIIVNDINDHCSAPTTSGLNNGVYQLYCYETCTDGIQNQDETGVDCGGVSCPPCPTCDAPTGVGYFSNSMQRVTFSWDADPDADNYQIRWKQAGDASWNNVGNSPGNDFKSIFPLQGGTTYQFGVRKFCLSLGTWSPYSTTQNFTQPMCLAPTAVMFSKYANGDHKIEWTAAPTFIKYQVRYREIGTSAWTTVGTTPGQNFKRIPAANMVDGTTYEVRIRSLCNTSSPTSQNVWSFYSPYYNYTPSGGVRMMQDIQGLSLENVYPNPVDKQLNIELYSSSENRQVNIRIVDLLGKTIYEKALGLNQGLHREGIAVNNWESGYYMVIVQDGEKQLTRKFMKM